MTKPRAFAVAALAAAGSTAVAAADLTFTSVSTRHVTYRRGSEMVFHFFLKNQGNLVSSNPVVHAMLSNDNVITLQDQELGNRLFEALLPGATLEQYIPAMLPINVAPGLHFVGLYVTSLDDGNPANNGVADPVQIEVFCPGDTDGNQVINFADLNTVLSQYGNTAGVYTGDVNGDTDVNFADLNLVLANFGHSGC